MLTPQVYVTNAGDGTISVLDSGVTTVQSMLQVDGRLYVADGDAGSVTAFDPSSGEKLQTISVGPNLTGLAVTPDGRYAVTSSSNPENRSVRGGPGEQSDRRRHGDTNTTTGGAGRGAGAGPPAPRSRARTPRRVMAT